MVNFQHFFLRLKFFVVNLISNGIWKVHSGNFGSDSVTTNSLNNSSGWSNNNNTQLLTTCSGILHDKLRNFRQLIKYCAIVYTKPSMYEYYYERHKYTNERKIAARRAFKSLCQHCQPRIPVVTKWCLNVTFVTKNLQRSAIVAQENYKYVFEVN